MAGKTGKKLTGRKRLTSNRTNVTTEGAFALEQVHRIRSKGPERNVDKATSKRIRAGGQVRREAPASAPVALAA